MKFDNDPSDLIVKHLMRVAVEELERFYGDRALVDLIRDIIDLEKKYPKGKSFPLATSKALTL